MRLTECSLGDLIEVTRGASLSGEYYATEGSLIRLTCGNFDYNNNCFKENTSKEDIFFSGKVKPEYILKKGDIITPLTEQAVGLLGSTAIIPESGKYIQSQDVAKIICKEGKIDENYAFYLVSSDMVKKQLSATAQQTKIRHTSPDAIKGCKVFVPDFLNQKMIGLLFSKIDEKIALNRRINAKLEQMAKRLYDYWFVQFDFPDKNGKPYKSSGGKMVWNEQLKREIPVGWEVKTIKEACLRIQSGGTPNTQNRAFYEGSINWFSTQELQDGYLLESIKHISKDAIMNSSAKLFPKGTVLIAIYAAPTVGRLGILTNEASFNQACCGFIVNTKMISLEYLFMYLKDSRIKLNTLAEGTAQKNLNVSKMKDFPIIIPPPDVLMVWDRYNKPLFNMISKNATEKQKLTTLRDCLLPLLMNGQVEVG